MLVCVSGQGLERKIRHTTTFLLSVTEIVRWFVLASAKMNFGFVLLFYLTTIDDEAEFDKADAPPRPSGMD
jgi:hypothetical protein